MSKFNKFNTLLENAVGYYNNGGFRVNSCVKLKPAFFSCDYFKAHLDDEFGQYLKDLVTKNKEYFFFIKSINANSSMQNVKDANSTNGTDPVYLELGFDPRVVRVPTEISKFTVPGNMMYVEVVKFDGNNLPPVQSEPNKYEKPIGTKPEVVKYNTSLGNLPKDNSLPTS